MARAASRHDYSWSHFHSLCRSCKDLSCWADYLPNFGKRRLHRPSLSQCSLGYWSRLSSCNGMLICNSILHLHILS
jgi:hypothetical protein